MYKYNKYNQEIYLKFLKINENFDEYNENKYIDLLYLIYFTLYQENIFKIIEQDLKYLIISLIKILNIKYWDNNFFNYSNNIKKYIQLYLKIINETNDFTYYQINYKTKIEIENILIKYNQITESDINVNKNVYIAGLNNTVGFRFDLSKIKKFFEIYQIDFSKEYLNINNIKIPNYYLLKNNNSIIDFETSNEFIHQLFKIYAPYLYYGHIFQEGYEYKISSSDIIFDCGGNMGLFAIYCASQGAQVYCFEPLSYIRKFLKKSQELYPNNIHIIPYGVFDDKKSTIFYQTVNPGASSEINVNNDKNLTTLFYKEQCQLISLDEFSKNTSIIPTFIKIDVEGAENKVLLGAKEIIKNYKPTIHLALNHNFSDPYLLPNQLLTINNNYEFYKCFEGDANSQFVLCK